MTGLNEIWHNIGYHLLTLTQPNDAISHNEKFPDSFSLLPMQFMLKITFTVFQAICYFMLSVGTE